MASKLIYLDYAAATPLDDKVLTAMKPYFSEMFYNPTASYQPARDVRADIENARHNVAQILGARSNEVVFTAGATESINLALGAGGHVVTSNIEHPAVLEAAKSSPSGCTVVGVDKTGWVDSSEIQKAITKQTQVISIGLVNNEIGTLQKIKDIAEVIKNERLRRQTEGNDTPIYLHSDASQAAGVVDLHVSRLGIDMLTLNGGKIYGPKQTGILYANSSVKLKPLIYGGGQEKGLRSGTENVAGIIGFTKALEIAEKIRTQEYKRLQELKNQTKKALTEAFEDAEVISPKNSAPHILSIAWPGLDAERVLFGLENEGVLVATGSACAANKETRSHVLEALGLPEKTIDGSLRLSFGRQTTSKELDRAVKIIVTVIKKELQRVSRK